MKVISRESMTNLWTKVFTQMMRSAGFGIFFIYWVSLSVSQGSWANEKPKTQAPVPLLTNQLLRNFQRAQRAELRTLERENHIALKKLKREQDLNRKAWEKAEEKARHQFFLEHRFGQDRRPYIQDFLQRKKALYQNFLVQLQQQADEQAKRLRELKKTQLDRLQSFQSSLEAGKEPARELWPVPENVK